MYAGALLLLLWQINEKSFKKFYIDDMGNIAWGKNRDLYFPIDELHDGTIRA